MDMTVEVLKRESLPQHEIEKGRARRTFAALRSRDGQNAMSWIIPDGQAVPDLGDVFTVTIERATEDEWDDEESDQ